MLGSIGMNVAKMAATAKVKAIAHAPAICFGIGVTSSVGAIVMTIHGTVKATDILEEHNKKMEELDKARNEIKEAQEKGELEKEKYTDQDYKREMASIYRATVLKLCKVYAPAVILEALSLSTLFASNNIMRKRNASLTAAYAAVDQAFKKYRERTVERYGEEVDKELRYGVRKETREFEETDENGKTKKVKEKVNVMNETPTPTEYWRVFDCNNDNWNWDSEGNYLWLHAMQQIANDLLHRNGYLILNDVYDMLGFEPTKEGMIVGWTDSNKPDDIGDNYVNFTITPFRSDDDEDRKYSRSNPRLIIDFNVEGTIFDKVPDRDAVDGLKAAEAAC